jgi:hypothetical protein
MRIGPTTNTWQVSFNGKAYKISRSRFPAVYKKADSYGPAEHTPARSYWRVASDGRTHWRDLADTSPVYKKVLKAFKDHIGETMQSDCIGA